MDENADTQYSFEALKDRIIVALNTTLSQSPTLQHENGFEIIDGFINITQQSNISAGLVIGGPSIPAIGIVGSRTGQIYYFALGKLLPDVLRELNGRDKN